MTKGFYLNEVKSRNLTITFVILVSFLLHIFTFNLIEIGYIHVAKLFIDASLLAYIFFKSPVKKRYSTSILFLIIIFAIYIFFAFISRIILGISFRNSVFSLVTDLTTLMMFLIYYHIAVRIKIYKGDCYNILNIFLYFTLFFIIYSFVFDYEEYIMLINSRHAYASNVSSVFTNRNIFAFYIFTYISVFLSFKNYYIKKVGRFLYFLVFILLNTVLLSTLSRSSLISTLLIYSFNILHNFSKNRNQNKMKISKVIYILCISVAAIFSLIYIFNNRLIIDFITEKVIRKNYLTTGRTDIWEAALENWKRNTFFGVGSFESISTIDFGSFHNTFLEILVRNGIFGAALRIVFYLKISRYHLNENIISDNTKSYFIIFNFGLLFSMLFESRLLFQIGFREITIFYILFILFRDDLD